MAERGRNHFSSEQWIDFVNGRLETTKVLEIEEHLGKGCGSCAKLAGTWLKVRRAARHEAFYEAPESAVKHVQNAFRVLSPGDRKKSIYEVPRLVFDSLWQPAAAGVRASAANTPRQVLYRAGEIAIEMRLEPELRSELVSLAGQVSSFARKGEGLPQIHVIVAGLKGVAAEAKTNDFGEFQLTFLPDEGLHISFGKIDGKDLSIPLEGRGGVRIFYRN